MKTIVAFGDALTWGYDPKTSHRPRGAKMERFSDEERWPGVMLAELGEGYKLIVEGLKGRTTVWDDPLAPGLSAAGHLIPVLDSHAPLDLLIIMLGTNDLKHYLGVSARDIARGVGVLIHQALFNAADDFVDEPKVLLISPPHLGEGVNDAQRRADFRGGLAKSKKLGAQYRIIAERYGVAFFDSASVIKASEIDQWHIDVDQHEILGKAIAPVVREMLAD